MLTIIISEAEWEIMRVVWSKKETTSAEIIATLSGEMNWKAPTIKTLIGRLVRKNVLKTEKEGNRFLYQATLSEQQAIKERLSRSMSQICAKKIGSTMQEIIETTELSVTDIQLLEETLKRKKLTAKDQLECSCIVGQCNC